MHRLAAIAPMAHRLLRYAVRSSLVLAGMLAAASAAYTAPFSPMAPAKPLPPGTLRGPIDRLQQYPQLSLATRAQRAAARRLLRAVRDGIWAWRDPARAELEGFRTSGRHTLAANAPTGWLHAENARFTRDRRFLDPTRPEVIIYANVRGHPLSLVGVMFSVPRGVHGPTPGGVITRWHTHRVCAAGNRRGLAPRSHGSCPPGTRLRQGSEMLHVWLTRDIRSGFAIRPPERELCAAGLIPANRCNGRRHATTHRHGGR